jgi:preprotein translocase subunit SecG
MAGVDVKLLIGKITPRCGLLKQCSTRSGKHKLMVYIHGLIVALHILVCFFIIVVVLLQSGKSGDISAAFGGQGSQTAFGPRGAASALSKATTWSAVAFMITSITLSVYATKNGGPTSVVEGIKSQPVKTQPAPAQAPAPAPTQPK